MTNFQDKLLDEIESIIIRLYLSDKEDKAKGEIEDIKRAIQETRRALENN